MYQPRVSLTSTGTASTVIDEARAQAMEKARSARGCMQARRVFMLILAVCSFFMIIYGLVCVVTRHHCAYKKVMIVGFASLFTAAFHFACLIKSQNYNFWLHATSAIVGILCLGWTTLNFIVYMLTKVTGVYGIRRKTRTGGVPLTVFILALNWFTVCIAHLVCIMLCIRAAVYIWQMENPRGFRFLGFRWDQPNVYTPPPCNGTIDGTPPQSVYMNGVGVPPPVYYVTPDVPRKFEDRRDSLRSDSFKNACNFKHSEF